jgi:hypothetical protein
MMRTSSSARGKAVGTSTQLLFRALSCCALLLVDETSGCARLDVFLRCPDVRGVVLECLECCALAQTNLSAAATCRHGTASCLWASDNAQLIYLCRPPQARAEHRS